MFARHVSLACCLASFAVACGGAVFSPRDDHGDGGSNGVGAGSSKGGTTSASGGKAGGAGAQAIAGSTSMGGGVDCAFVDCAFVNCADGQPPITPAGDCCPMCPPPRSSCSDVKCQPVMGCPGGYVLSQPLGACCQGCVPQPGSIACPEIACPQSLCPLGYIRGDRVGGCCSECVPDALFCNDDSECVIAERPRTCCDCPQPITRREYAADVCWSDVDEPRPIPQDCYPQAVCGAICVACPSHLNAACEDHHCTQIGLK